MSDKIVIGSRGSKLALAQSRMMEAALREARPGLECSIEIIKTTGDRMQDASLTLDGGKGLFTKEIEEALLADQVDLAVHSLKDLPTELPEGLTLGAITRREDPRDAWISRNGKKLDEIEQGATVGTSSPRRVSQLKRRRPDLKTLAIRGNVDTRLRKLEEGLVDALLMAGAGLNRLGLQGEATEFLDCEQMLPAPAQGFLGIECRAGDERVLKLLEVLKDDEAVAEAGAERGFLAALGGGCQAPVAAWARREGDRLLLTGLVSGDDEFFETTVEGEAEDWESMAQELASGMLVAGAKKYLT